MGRRGSAEEFEVFAGHRAGVLALAPLSAVMGEHVPLGGALVRWAVLGAAGIDLRSWGCSRVRDGGGWVLRACAQNRPARPRWRMTTCLSREMGERVFDYLMGCSWLGIRRSSRGALWGAECRRAGLARAGLR